jgi:shikimate dehydrogenase
MTLPLNPPITGASQLVLILGHPLHHSLSPAMQNEAFMNKGLSWVYAPLETPPDRLKDAARLMRDSNVRGANVTVPYKEAIMSYLDGIAGECEWLKSVNTIYRKGKKLLGTSTDGEGFLRAIGAKRRQLRGSMGLLLGSGGAAKAVAGALARTTVKGFYVTDLVSSRAKGLEKLIRRRFPRMEIAAVTPAEAQRVLPSCQWVVQATTCGLKKSDPSPLPLSKAQSGTWVMDLIYHHETAFLKEARARRLPRVSGLDMLLYQGAMSFEIWTGMKAPLEVMRRALLRQLASRGGHQPKRG